MTGRDELARREPVALEAARQELRSEMAICAASSSFSFMNSGVPCAVYCAQRSIRVVGDIAIFVDYDSADVWAHRDLFRLRKTLEPEVVAGVPPDAFSATGQRWGNPLYDWDAMRARGYDWWIERLRWATQTCDYIRLDHFRGFEQFWEIPASEPTAMHGRWVDGPKDELVQQASRSARRTCRSSPKTWATSRPKCTPCASATRFPEWPFCSLVSAITAPTFTCRTA